MKSTRVAGSKGLIEATIDGMNIYRTEEPAAARGESRQRQVEWSRIATVEFIEPSTGKAAVKVTLVGDATDAKSNPYVMKVRRKDRPEAREFVRLVNEEITQRQRWIRHSPTRGTTSQ